MLTWHGKRFGLIMALVLALPTPAAAIYGGSPVPSAKGGAVVYFTARAARMSGNCSGVLIGQKAVLTAAHCILTSRGRRRRVRSVRVGNPAGSIIRVPAAKVHVHPGYDPKKPAAGNDLAIILLKRAVKGRTPVSLTSPTDDPKRQGKRLTITGFGVTRKGRRIVRSRKLLSTSQEYLSPFHCFRGVVKKMAATRMCAISPRSGVCPGDSGAPVLLEGDGGKQILVGIVSLALDRKRCSDTATIITRVSAFRDWITKVTS